MRKDQKISRARDLFIHQGWDEEQIGLLFGVSERTVKSWARKGGWEDERLATETSPFQLSMSIKKAIWEEVKRARLMDDSEGLAGKADSLSKLMSIAEKLDKKADILGHALIILRDLAEWLNTHYPAIAKSFAPVFPLFSDWLWAKYSK